MAEERERFEAGELAVCLSHYDLGLIESIREFPRGSRRSPKVVIDCERGRFLFKRRARGKDDLEKVAFTHSVQLHLAGESFPLPHLIGTRGDNNSMLVREGRIYELFEYVKGGGYDGSLDATYDAGRVLGLYHKLLAGFQSDYRPPKGSYHGSRAIHEAVGKTGRSLPAEDPDEVAQTLSVLQQAYQSSFESANALGLTDWPVQIVHGDWHPGNMLFRGGQVVGVIDYDSARLQQRVIDLANGALQFSITSGSDDPSQWPEYVDETRLKRFLLAYDSINVISKAELKAVPYLMCEAMIAEAVLPIAATGSFGRMEGLAFLQMIRRKVKWVRTHTAQIEAVLKD